MNRMLSGSICVSDIDKSKIVKAKNGKLYFPIVVWVNESEDEYGNIASIQVAQTKEEREQKVKATYIGNLKDFSKDSKPTQQETDDLPF